MVPTSAQGGHVASRLLCPPCLQPLLIGSLQLKHRLIQGPLAGFSCAPFRQLFSLFTPPAYCVSEMLSAHDVLHKHQANGRYLYRSPDEETLCYQIAGADPSIMAEAAIKLEHLGADLIDINCGCPKPKIRKKGAGSMLLEDPKRLLAIVKATRMAIRCPLTVKIRLQGSIQDIELAKAIADSGADALVVHGRRWQDNYDEPCNFQQIARIKQSISIPVIANGDISDPDSLQQALSQTGCDAYMIARASTGKPWLFQTLLTGKKIQINHTHLIRLFMTHLQQLAMLESEHQAVLQSKSLVRYYFKDRLHIDALRSYYDLSSLKEIESFLPVNMLDSSTDFIIDAQPHIQHRYHPNTGVARLKAHDGNDWTPNLDKMMT